MDPNAQIVTEEDLQKALKVLVGAPEDPKDDKPKVITLDILQKALADTVKDQGSPELKKAMESSTFLNEFVTLVGHHIDSSLKAFEKSLQASAERDQAFTAVLTKFNKSLDDNTAAISKFGEQPAPKTADAKDVLEKGTVDGKVTTLKVDKDPKVARRQISLGLEKLAKGFDPKTQEFADWMKKATIFEAAGTIGQADMHAALRAIGAMPAAAA